MFDPFEVDRYDYDENFIMKIRDAGYELISKTTEKASDYGIKIYEFTMGDNVIIYTIKSSGARNCYLELRFE